MPTAHQELSGILIQEYSKYIQQNPPPNNYRLHVDNSAIIVVFNGLDGVGVCVEYCDSIFLFVEATHVVVSGCCAVEFYDYLVYDGI